MIRLLSLTAALAAVLAAGPLSNRRAPGFSLPDSKLQQHDPQDYRGKILIVDIMKTDCPHCQAAAQTLERVKAKFGDRVGILSVVTAGGDNQTTVAQFIRTFKITTPILFDCGQMTASYLNVTPANPQIEIPHLFLIDGDGIIRNDWSYSLLTREIFESDGLFAEVGKLMKETAKTKR